MLFLVVDPSDENLLRYLSKKQSKRTKNSRQVSKMIKTEPLLYHINSLISIQVSFSV